jgi:agmatine deiminase
MTTPRALGFAMPAEWHLHAATWLAWPHDDEQWLGMLEPVRREFAAFVSTIARFEPVRLLVDDEESARDATARLGSADVTVYHVPHGDVWLRDSGPTFLLREDDLALVDWEFNGWGCKYPAALDNEIPTHIARLLGGATPFRPGIVMEGGSIEVDGRGTVLTTRQCLGSEERNATLGLADVEGYLRDYLGVTHVVWLDEGLEGDHTDGHIDTITRFVNEQTVVTAIAEDRDDPNHAILEANLDRLRAAQSAQGQPYRIVTLPIPRGRAEFDGERLPLTYANFYIANDAVLLPTYGDVNDTRAVEILQPLFPGRVVIPLGARDLITGGGAFHCVTQQQPTGRVWGSV